MQWIQISPHIYVTPDTSYMLRRENTRYLDDWLVWRRIDEDWFYRDTFDSLEEAMEYEGEKQPA